MNPIKLSVIIGEDRKLVIDLPPEVPTGAAELTITPTPVENPVDSDPAAEKREMLRAKLKAAGFLTDYKAPQGARRLTDEELWQIGQLPPGAKPSEVLISEDRDERW